MSGDGKETGRPASGIARSGWAHLPLVLLLGAYAAAASIAIRPLGQTLALVYPDYFLSFLAGFAIFLVIAGLRALIFHVLWPNPEPLAARTRAAFRRTYWPEFLMLAPAPAMVFIFVQMSAFKSFKPNIPDLAPFTWDPLLAAWDRVFFLGMDGWRVTHALLPDPMATWLMDWLYMLWFPVSLCTALAASFRPLEDPRRLAFLLGFGLNWIIAGSLLAVVFSSAGPVYYDLVVGDDLYVPLVERLREIGQDYTLGTVRGIDLLWAGHIGTEGIERYGISAFPSLHVATAAIVWFYARSHGRGWGWPAGLFVACTLFGSVHLGWHYLLDGIAGIALAWAHWRGAIWFSRRWLARLPAR